MHRFVADDEAFSSYRLVHWSFSGGETVLLFHVVGDQDRYEAALEAVADIIDVEVSSQGPSSFTVYVRDEPDATARELLDAFAVEPVVAVPPLEYREDWTVRFSVVGTGEALQRALTGVPDTIDVEIGEISDYARDPTVARLTPRQREAVATARDLGYYEVPRETSLEEVAAHLECAPGTAAEHLRKAERTVMGTLDLS
jgi:hypothetical protein